MVVVVNFCSSGSLETKASQSSRWVYAVLTSGFKPKKNELCIFAHCAFVTPNYSTQSCQTPAEDEGSIRWKKDKLFVATMFPPKRWGCWTAQRSDALLRKKGRDVVGKLSNKKMKRFDLFCWRKRAVIIIIIFAQLSCICKNCSECWSSSLCIILCVAFKPKIKGWQS